MDTQARSRLDALIEAAHARATLPALNDPMTEEACIQMDCDAQGLVLVGEDPDVESAEAKAEFFEDDLQPDRVEEIRAGAPLNDEEEESWQRHTEYLGETMDGFSVMRAVHSRQPSLVAYSALGLRRFAQSGYDLTGWAGPTPSIEPVLSLVAEKARTWHDVFVYDSDVVTKNEHGRVDEDAERVRKLVEETISAVRRTRA
jgi:hypothetical protein